MKRKVKRLLEDEAEVCDKCDIPKAEDAREMVIHYYHGPGTIEQVELTKMLCHECTQVTVRSLTKRKRSPTAPEPAAPKPEGNGAMVARIENMVADCCPNNDGACETLYTALFPDSSWKEWPRDKLQPVVNILLAVRERTEGGDRPLSAEGIRKMVAEARSAIEG